MRIILKYCGTNFEIPSQKGLHEFWTLQGVLPESDSLYGFMEMVEIKFGNPIVAPINPYPGS